jgi:hypothetical protein
MERLVRLSSFMAEIAANIFLLGGYQRAVEEHINSRSRVLVERRNQTAKQAVKPVSHLADLLPKQKGVKVIYLANALATDPNGLGWAVGIHALLKKLIRGKVCIMSGIDPRDLSQLLEKSPCLIVGNIS